MPYLFLWVECVYFNCSYMYFIIVSSIYFIIHTLFCRFRIFNWKYSKVMILLNQLKICIGYILYPYGMFNIFSLFLSYIFIFSHFLILFCFPKQNLRKCVTCFFHFDQSYCQLLKIYHMKWIRSTKCILFVLFDNCLIWENYPCVPPPFF